MKTQFLKNNRIDALAPLALILALTAGSIFSGCGPQVRTDDNNSSAASTAETQYLATNGTSLTLSGPSGSVTYPSSGLLTGVDGSLKVIVGLGEYTTVSGTGYSPPYTCAGYRVKLERVMMDGSTSEVNTHDASPIAMKSGSTYCSGLASAAFNGATQAPSTLAINYDSTALVRLPNVRGYRVVITNPVNDYKRTDCIQKCATSWNCGGWASTMSGTPEERCSGYPIQPLYSTHRLEIRAVAQIN